MRLMILVFIGVLALDVAMVAFLMQFEYGSIPWYWQLAVGIPVGFINATAIWWLSLGGRWRKPSPFVNFEMFAAILRKEGVTEAGIQMLWFTRPREFSADEEQLLRASVRSVKVLHPYYFEN